MLTFKQSMKKAILLFLSIIGLLALNGQNRVKLTQKGKLIKFAAVPQARFENKNGVISLSVKGGNGRLLELLNISEEEFTCGKRFNSDKVKITLIDEVNNKTYHSSSNVNVSISCTNEVKQYIVVFTGTIKSGNTIINVSALLTVKSKPRENITTF